MVMDLIVLATLLAAGSGVPGLLMSRRSSVGEWIAVGLIVTAALMGFGAIGYQLAFATAPAGLSEPWSLPWGRFAIGLNAIGMVFLTPILCIASLGAIYGLAYWPQAFHRRNGRKLRLCWGLLTAAMMMIVVARDAVLFLMAWEVMGLATFFLISTKDDDVGATDSGWIYLVAAHVSVLALMGMFALLRVATGSFALWSVLPTSSSSVLATGIFILGVLGFGLKAGFMPLHVWLPGAHANAPSHVSAFLSGVGLAMGVFGVVMVSAQWATPPIWWGGLLVVLGAGTSLGGIIFAMAQSDYKRLLAYSSVENIGIVLMGIGLAVVGRAVGQPLWILLGLGGALLHILNHSLFKPLLFFGAGNVLHATGTREIQMLGGIAHRMPRTAGLMAIGSAAICGLPPLNGFISEWMIYLGLFNCAVVPAGLRLTWLTLAAPALAVAGALALAAFVKLFGMTFLGLPRSLHAAEAHEAGILAIAPMWVLAFGCVVLGLAPVLVLGLLERAIARWDAAAFVQRPSLAAVEPLQKMSLILGGLAAALLLGVWLVYRIRPRMAVVNATWGCGYGAPTSRMQYSGGSFVRMLTDAYRAILWPRRSGANVIGFAPEAASASVEFPDTVLDRGLLPGLRMVGWLAGRARPLQSQAVGRYLLYVLVALVVLLVTAVW
ncbi:MAG: hydrogenase [Phycisphaerales bacterium]|nr:hydrogenase [Phycisphaerales bacterium]